MDQKIETTQKGIQKGTQSRGRLVIPNPKSEKIEEKEIAKEPYEVIKSGDIDEIYKLLRKNIDFSCISFLTVVELSRASEFRTLLSEAEKRGAILNYDNLEQQINQTAKERRSFDQLRHLDLLNQGVDLLIHAIKEKKIYNSDVLKKLKIDEKIKKIFSDLVEGNEEQEKELESLLLFARKKVSAEFLDKWKSRRLQEYQHLGISFDQYLVSYYLQIRKAPKTQYQQLVNYLEALIPEVLLLAYRRQELSSMGKITEHLKQEFAAEARRDTVDKAAFTDLLVRYADAVLIKRSETRSRTGGYRDDTLKEAAKDLIGAWQEGKFAKDSQEENILSDIIREKLIPILQPSGTFTQEDRYKERTIQILLENFKDQKLSEELMKLITEENLKCLNEFWESPVQQNSLLYKFLNQETEKTLQNLWERRYDSKEIWEEIKDILIKKIVDPLFVLKQEITTNYPFVSRDEYNDLKKQVEQLEELTNGFVSFLVKLRDQCSFSQENNVIANLSIETLSKIELNSSKRIENSSSLLGSLNMHAERQKKLQSEPEIPEKEEQEIKSFSHQG